MKRIAMIGGGLAGCAAAYVLTAAGHSCVIYEAGETLASGASGNMLGLYNPRFSATFYPPAQYYSAAFYKAIPVFERFDDVEFNPAGCLHLITDERKAIRFSKMVASWGWSLEEMRIVDASEASEIAGVEVAHDALYLPRSGSVNPAKLCVAYTKDIEVRLNTRIEDFSAIDADVVILAAGPAVRHFEQGQGLELYPVRGQVTMVRETPVSKALKCHVNYNGYMSMARDGLHMVGSTFERYADHCEVRAGDDEENLQGLAEAFPTLAVGLEVACNRAAVRTASKDYFPVVGQVCDGVYVSTAHGSHGILSTLMAAEVLANMIDNKPQALSDEVIAALSPRRFID